VFGLGPPGGFHFCFLTKDFPPKLLGKTHLHSFMDRPEQVGAVPGPWPVDVSLAAGAICCGSAPAALTVASALAHRDATEVCWKV